MHGRRRATWPILAFAIVLGVLGLHTARAAEFFAMDTGTRDAQHETPEAQVGMLAALGYAGIGWTGADGLPEVLAALDKNGLRLFTIYYTLDIDTATPDAIAPAIETASGRDAFLWLSLTSASLPSSAPEGDAKAVALVQGIAERAAQANLKVALYPHVDAWLERVDDALRVVQAVNLPNVGATFNLYHWLREGDRAGLSALLDRAVPSLFAVTINGSSNGGTIETLGSGAFDILGLLVALDARGYSGPIGLQGYGIGGNVHENLKNSMQAWRATERLLEKGWTAPLSAGDLSGFRSPTGEWLMAGNAILNPTDEKRLSTEPGIGVSVNGEAGKTTHLITQLEHGDIEAHIEFVVPKGSNSGVYFQGRYEIQVLDSWGVTELTHGDCGGIYQRYHEEPGLEESQRGYEGRPPLINASRAPGEWQSFDVIFRAPRFDANGAKTANAAFLSVWHNGVLVHGFEELSGPTRAALYNDEQPLGPMMFQGDHGPVAYRNIRIRSIDLGPCLEILSYDFGQSRAAMLELERRIQAAPAAGRPVMEARLLATLASPEATFACKQFVCRQLQLVGTERAVPALTSLLIDPKLGHMARNALLAIPGSKSLSAMLDALDSADDALKAGLINTLGDRHSDDAVPALAELLNDANPNLVALAASALGTIASDAAFSVLLQASPEGTPERQEALARAMLACAERMLADGDMDKAAGVYEALQAAVQQPATVRAAAFKGLVLARGDAGLPSLADALSSGDRHRLDAALELARTLDGPAATKALAGALPSLSPDRAALVVEALGDRGDASILPDILPLIGHENDGVRLAALKAAGALGDTSAVGALVEAAAATKGREKEAAQQALARLRGAEIDAALVSGLADSIPGKAIVCIEALDARHVAAAASVLAVTAHANVEVRLAALKALEHMAAGDNMSVLAAILKQPQDEREREPAERAFAAAASVIPDEAARHAAIKSAFPEPCDTALRISLARVYGRITDAASLAKIRELIGAPEPEVADAAVRALAEWPTPEPISDLMPIAKSSANETHRVLALRGAIRMFSLPAERPVEETLNLYEEALQLAARAEEKRLALASLQNIAHERALALAVAQLDNPEIVGEAAVAVLKISEGLAQGLPEAVRPALEKLIQIAPSPDTVTKAQALLGQLPH